MPIDIDEASRPRIFSHGAEIAVVVAVSIGVADRCCSMVARGGGRSGVWGWSGIRVRVGVGRTRRARSSSSSGGGGVGVHVVCCIGHEVCGAAASMRGSALGAARGSPRIVVAGIRRVGVARVGVAGVGADVS